MRLVRSIAALACAVPVFAQDGAAGAAPVLHVAFAAERDPSAPPALSWLRADVLATRPGWPAGWTARQPFVLHATTAGLRFLPAQPLPAGLCAAGSCTLPGGGTIAFAVDERGREDWFADAAASAMLQRVLAALHVEIDGAPRVLDPAALVGNLLGAVVDGDPDRSWLPLAAAACGETTIAARRRDDGLHVRGESHGGLLLGAVAIWRAMDLAHGRSVEATLADWQLRAFASRDGDRAEAARQLQRAGAAALPTLRALLRGDEACRLAAIDGLLRMEAAGELPRIVAAATAQPPLLRELAAEAVLGLWPRADAPTRAATIAALRSDPLVAPDRLAGMRDRVSWPTGAGAGPPRRWREAAFWFVLAMATAGFWWRERCRLAAAPLR